jgi:hypothetical protein
MAVPRYPLEHVHLPASPSYPSSSEQGVASWQSDASPFPFAFHPLPGQGRQPLGDSVEVDWVSQVPKNPALQIHSFPSAEKTTGEIDTDEVARKFPIALSGLVGGWRKDGPFSHGVTSPSIKNTLLAKACKVLPSSLRSSITCLSTHTTRQA